jgi:hypothetical protein
MEFLGASEQAWREKVRQEREEEERRRLEEIDRQTRAEREHRLEAEARAGRRFKILAGILAAVLVFALLMAWAAVEQRRAAVEQGRRAEVAAAEESRQRQLAEERLTRITNGIRLKQAVLSGDTARISAALGSELANKTIRFDAERNYLGYKNPQGKPVFEFFLFPDEKSIPGGLGSIASITYRMDHPTFRNALLTTGPDRRFRASYIGWGCLTNVTVLIEYVEPDRSPEIAAFDMCDALVGAGI